MNTFHGTEQGIENRGKGATILSHSDWLRVAADRRERQGQPVTALLFRNEAFRLEAFILNDLGEGEEKR